MGKKRRRRKASTAVAAGSEPTETASTANAQNNDDVAEKKKLRVDKVPGAAGQSGTKPDSEPEKTQVNEKENDTSDVVIITDAEKAEQKRIENQKKLQKMVIRMRARGKSEKEIRKAKIKFKREVNMRRRIADPSTQPRAQPKPKKLTKREEHVQEWKARNPTEAQVKGKKHNLVIVPVLWRHKEEESDDILAACATIKKYLSSFGLDVWIDERTKYVALCESEQSGVKRSLFCCLFVARSQLIQFTSL